jgi:O-antigen ligase
VGNRPELWRAALFFFKEHPLLGIGAGNYELELPLAGVFGVRTHANEWYLQQLAEGGLILFAATIAFIVSVVRSLLRDVRSSPWRVAALAVTAALCIHQLADFLVFYPKIGLPWMILIGLGIAATPNLAACEA